MSPGGRRVHGEGVRKVEFWWITMWSLWNSRKTFFSVQIHDPQGNHALKLVVTTENHVMRRYNQLQTSPLLQSLSMCNPEFNSLCLFPWMPKSGLRANAYSCQLSVGDWAPVSITNHPGMWTSSQTPSSQEFLSRWVWESSRYYRKRVRENGAENFYLRSH